MYGVIAYRFHEPNVMTISHLKNLNTIFPSSFLNHFSKSMLLTAYRTEKKISSVNKPGVLVFSFSQIFIGDLENSVTFVTPYLFIRGANNFHTLLFFLLLFQIHIHSIN